MRSQARDAVFKYLFSTLFNQDDEGLFAVLITDLKKEDKIFAQQLLDAVLVNRQKYCDKIEELSENFSFNRIFNTDKVAILIGMAEHDKFSDTPIAVIIDEAVKLASIYSTEKGTDFVNGILASYVRG